MVRDEILDEFQGFIEDEEHAILISSHITSDLEKIADYITYIHQGRVVLSDSKDAILEHYAKLGCTQAQLRDIQPEIWCGCGRAASAVKRWYGTGRPLPGNTPA